MDFNSVLTLVLAVVVWVLVFSFLVGNYYFWKERDVRGPKPAALFGSFKNMVLHFRSVVYDMQDIYKQYKAEEDFVGVYSIRTPQLMVTSAEMAHKILVTDFNYFRYNEQTTWINFFFDSVFSKDTFVLRDEEWKETRLEVKTALTEDKIRASYAATKKACDELVHYMKQNCTKPRNSRIDIKHVCLRYTSEAIADFVLGLKAQSFSKNPTPIPQMTKKLFEGTKMFTFYSFFADFWPPMKRTYKAKFFQPDTEKFFVDLISSALEERRQQTSDYSDFCSHILQQQCEKNHSNAQTLSHAMTFLLDGLETSASVIAGCLYQLAKYLEKQQKLRQEISTHLNQKGEIDFDSLETMTYLDQCLHESIRLIPPILFSKKLCTEKCELTSKSGSKVRLQPGMSVLIPIYALHHDERYYTDPEEFIPERFDPENGGHKKFRDKGAFFPFGDGPRMCLGMNFALTLTKTAVAEIIRNFNVKLNSKSRTDNRIRRAYFIGSLQGGIWLDFEERLFGEKYYV